MTSALLHEVSTTAQPTSTAQSVDTVRALCHDLRQPLAAIRLLAETHGGDVQGRLDAILQQAQWLTDVVEGVIGDAADDRPGSVDVVDLVSSCVSRAQATAPCGLRFIGTDRAMVVAAPVALSRAVSCVLDNAMRAAGRDGQVTVEVSGTASAITIRVIDDGPGFGHVRSQNSLGLTITRALVCACGGEFELEPGTGDGMVARIVLPALSSRAMAS